MMEEMAQLHMTVAEVSGDFAAVLRKIGHGEEVVVDRDGCPVAVIRTLQGPGRSIDESIALAEAFESRLGYAPIPDEDFAKDVQDGIAARSAPLDVPCWD